jgi:hypothetical protein
MNVGFDPFGVSELGKALGRWVDTSSNPRPLFVEFADDQLRRNQARFDGTGVRWKKLAAATVALKARAGLDLRILRATRTLEQSLTRKSHADHIREIRSDEAFVGTSNFVARFHRAGTKHMPRRAPVGMGKADRQEVLGKG